MERIAAIAVGIAILANCFVLQVHFIGVPMPIFVFKILAISFLAPGTVLIFASVLRIIKEEFQELITKKKER